jgi:uncharacterized protein (TIGR02147 family)
MHERSADFKTYLQEELVLRSQRNPAYSLRSFAKALNISPSFMSKILNGQRRITDDVFHKLSANLNLEPSLIGSFRAEPTEHSALELRPLQIEYFKIISDWYHYALIELTHLKGFSDSPDWVASSLGITVNQAKAARERLIKLELLEVVAGRLKPTSGGNTTTKNEFTALAFKKMQDDLLRKALQSLWDDPLEKRDHSSISMAIDPADLPEVKKRLAKMRRELCAFLERPKKQKPTRVYNLSLAFFPLSKE